MAEPISDSELDSLRRDLGDAAGNLVVAFATMEVFRSVLVDDLKGLIARLDLAEAKLERIRKAIPRNQYLSLPMLVEVKEIVDG